MDYIQQRQDKYIVNLETFTKSNKVNHEWLKF